MRPLLLLMSTGSMSLYQDISGSGFPLAAHSMVAVRVRSTTFSWGPMSMEGKPWGTWFSETQQQEENVRSEICADADVGVGCGTTRAENPEDVRWGNWRTAIQMRCEERGKVADI